MSNKAGHLLRSTAIIAVGSIFVQVIGFLLLPVYTSFLSASDYGVVDLVQSYAGLVGPLITLQMGMTVFQFLIDARGDRRRTSEVISTALIAVAVLLVFFGGLGLLVGQFTQVAHPTIILSALVLGAATAVFAQVARGMGRNAVFAGVGIVSSLISAAIAVLLMTRFHMGAASVMIGMSIGSLFACLHYVVALKLHRFTHYKYVSRQLLNKMLRYTFPLIPATLSWWLIGASDRTIIAFFLGTDANGIYALASKFAMAFATLYSFFNMSWVESVSLHINSKDRDEFFSTVSNATVKFFGSMAAGVIAAVPLVFDVVIGKDFHAAYAYIPILLFAAFCNTVVGNYSAIYFAKKMTRSTATTAGLAALINIVVSLTLIHFIGLYATALATVVGYGVMAIYRHYDTKKYVHIRYEPFVFMKTLSLMTFAALCYYVNIPLLNGVSLVIIAAVSLWFNRSFIKLFKTKILSMARRLKKKPDLPPEIQI